MELQNHCVALEFSTGRAHAIDICGSVQFQQTGRPVNSSVERNGLESLPGPGLNKRGLDCGRNSDNWAGPVVAVAFVAACRLGLLAWRDDETTDEFRFRGKTTAQQRRHAIAVQAKRNSCLVEHGRRGGHCWSGWYLILSVLSPRGRTHALSLCSSICYASTAR